MGTQIRNRSLWMRWGEKREHGNIYITICKIDSKWDFAARHRELNPVLCDDPEG